MDLYAIRRTNAWATLADMEAAGAKSAEIGSELMADRVRWIRSYVIEEPHGGFGTICIYEARDRDSIREHAQRVGMPGEEIFAVIKTIVAREDPGEASAAA